MSEAEARPRKKQCTKSGVHNDIALQVSCIAMSEILFGGSDPPSKPKEENNYILLRILDFVGDTKDLCRFRQACWYLQRQCDVWVQQETIRLVGKHIKPTIDQSTLQVMAAEAENSLGFDQRIPQRYESSVLSYEF